jgi:hypothetical protein
MSQHYAVNARWNVRWADSGLAGYGAKHNNLRDFGFPANPAFDDFYRVYKRNGLGRAGVDKTIGKTWQDFPFLLEKPRDNGQSRKETGWEKRARQRFEDLRLWQQLAEADRRGMVGAYGGVILRLADDKKFIEAVDEVPGGLLGLVEIIPFWEAQLQVSEWDLDETSESYGQPKMFQFNEAAVDPAAKVQPRSFQVHPDRVLIWSRDGTLNGCSALESGLNDLLTMEKIIGAGGEGFWKNAKSSPVLKAQQGADFNKIAQALGVKVDEIYDLMNEQVESWQAGFDKLLMLQGMEADTLGIVLPIPEHFFSVACQSYAASLGMPMKVLVGMQTGERASTEDADEWAQTNMSRRSSMVIPNIMELIRRLERFGMIPERDWSLSWADLTEASADEKMARADKMASVNQRLIQTGERVFTGAEIRAAAGDYEPLSDADAKLDLPEPVDPKADPNADPDPAQE